MLETNIRAAYIYHFFSAPHRKSNKTHKSDLWVSDKQISPIAAMAAEGQDAREWNWALMDYGSYLKKLHPNPTRRSHTYRMQSKFEGSLRQVRGEVMRLLSGGPYGDLALAKSLTYDGRKVREALRGLQKDGLVVSERGSWRIA
jgi:A/G-specific adenine glycosylase